MQQRATDLVLQQAEVLCKEWSQEPEQWSEESLPSAGVEPETPSAPEPFLRVVPDEGGKYETCVPVLSLRAAAGNFGDIQSVEPDGWVQPKTARKLGRGMFVAQVVGKSMEPDVPDGSWCLFRAPVGGSRRGKTVLVQLRDAIDPETGERYTVKRYDSQKEVQEESWRHERIVLKPVNPEFEPIVLTGAEEGELEVVAELVEVLGV